MYEGKGSTGLVVACDPIDGSSNLDVNGTVGTIFALTSAKGQRLGDLLDGGLDGALARRDGPDDS